jgi:hypothetical protein
MEKLVEIERRVSRAPVIHGPGPLMSQDGQGFPLPMFFPQAGEVVLAYRVMAEEQDRGFGEGPLEGGMADLCARGPIACAGGFFGALDEAAIGDARLHAWNAMNIVELIQPHHGPDRADPRDRAPAGEGLRLVFLCRLDDRELEGSEPVVVVATQREIHLDTLVHGGIHKALGHTDSVRLVGELLATLRPVILAVGMLDMSQSCGPLAHPMDPAPKQVARGAPLGGIDRGLGQHPAAPQDRDVVRIAAVVFDLAPRDRLHGARMAQDKGHALLSPEVGEPVPGEEAFDADHDVLPVGGHRLEKWPRCCLQIPMQKDLSGLIYDAEGHGPGMQVDATVKLVRLGVESHEVSSSSVGSLPNASIPWRYAEEGASISINTLQRTGGIVAVHTSLAQPSLGGGFAARR